MNLFSSVVFIFTFACLHCRNGAIVENHSESYNVQKNVLVKDGQWVLSSFKAHSRLSCTAQCNLNGECLSAEYQLDSQSCRLFSEPINHEKLEDSSQGILFSKPSRNNFKFFFANHNLTKNYTGFSGLCSIEIVHNNNSVFYYAADLNANKVHVYDEDWILNKTIDFSVPAYIKEVRDYLYISLDTEKIFKATKGRLDKENEFDDKALRFRGIHFDDASDSLYVCEYKNSSIYVFDRNLTRKNVIKTPPGIEPFSIAGLNGRIFVGTMSNGSIYEVMPHEQRVVLKFQIKCKQQVHSLALDDYGYLVVACSMEKKLFLYSIDGAEKSEWTLNSIPKDVKIDTKGRFIIAANDMLLIYHHK